MPEIGSQYASDVNLGMPSNVPENFTNVEVIAAVRLFLTGMHTLLKAMEDNLGISQKDVSLWNVLLPNDTLKRQNLGRLYCIASEALAFGAFVHLWDDGGILKARNANATDNTRPARGYCNVTSGVGIGEECEVILSLGLLSITGIAPGQMIYTSIANGQATTVAPVAAGNITQTLGFGVKTDLAYIDIQLLYVQH